MQPVLWMERKYWVLYGIWLHVINENVLTDAAVEPAFVSKCPPDVHDVIVDVVAETVEEAEAVEVLANLPVPAEQVVAVLVIGKFQNFSNNSVYYMKVFYLYPCIIVEDMGRRLSNFFVIIMLAKSEVEKTTKIRPHTLSWRPYLYVHLNISHFNEFKHYPLYAK